MKMALGALVVLFNPSKVHIQNLLRLRSLCANIVAVDNSPTSDAKLNEQLQAEDIDILPNFNRGGVAGAYNKGLERLIQKKCRILFIFDQDSEVPDDYFSKMLAACLGLDNPHFLIGPKVLDVNVNRYLPAHVIRRFSVKSLPITDQKRGLLSCSSIITSGSVMSSETYRILGPFLEGYFIDHVDTEYSFRAMCNKIPVYVNTSLVLKHEVGKRVSHKLWFWKLIQWNTGPLRQYYSARNCIHISRCYCVKFPLLILINIITLQQVFSVVFYEEDKRRKVAAMIAGITDGLLGRYGSFEASRPRTFSFCTKQTH
jgi:GT2 family glycosyltransferase